MINLDHDRIHSISILSPVGWLTLFEQSSEIIALEWGQVKFQSRTHFLKAAKTEIIEFFNHQRINFSIPLNPTGTKFQKSVWKIIAKIPYGKTCTYREIASKLNSAPRPVGGACSKNPIPILIPCHRVIGSNNELTGFSGGFGIKTKQDLIKHESQVKNTLTTIT